MKVSYLFLFAGLTAWLPYCDSNLFIKDGFPKHENLFFVVDVDATSARILSSILAQLFNGISLLEYRIAVRTTNGFVRKIVDFQSRECLISDIVSKLTGNKTLSRKQVLGKAKDESRMFSNTQSVYIVITDDDLVSKKFQYIIRIPDDIVKGDEIRNDLLKTFHFYEDGRDSCNAATNRPKFFDECYRECDCQHGKLKNCYRVRRQFSKLTLRERRYYIKTYKTLFKHPAFKRYFLDLLSIHPKLDFKYLHREEQLLHFHRKYLLAAENVFRLLDCRITIPYWHFPLHQEHLYRTYKNYHIWDNDGGFGSTQTSAKNGYCVIKGEFAYPYWRLPPVVRQLIPDNKFVLWICTNKFTYSEWLENKCLLTLNKTVNRECISRAVNHDAEIMTISLSKAKELIEESSLENFNDTLRDFIIDVHAPMHDKTGGLFATGLASYAPEFFPMHSMIDALWDHWQNRGKEFLELFLYPDEPKLLWFNERRNKYADNSNLGECGVKIKYTRIF